MFLFGLNTVLKDFLVGPQRFAHVVLKDLPRWSSKPEPLWSQSSMTLPMPGPINIALIQLLTCTGNGLVLSTGSNQKRRKVNWLNTDRTDLEVYCHRGLPRFHRQRGFIHRPDSAYLRCFRKWLLASLFTMFHFPALPLSVPICTPWW